MRERVTTVLDVLGLLLVAFGAAALVYPWLSLGASVVAGVVVLIGSALATRRGEP